MIRLISKFVKGFNEYQNSLKTSIDIEMCFTFQHVSKFVETFPNFDICLRSSFEHFYALREKLLYLDTSPLSHEGTSRPSLPTSRSLHKHKTTFIGTTNIHTQAFEDTQTQEIYHTRDIEDEKWKRMKLRMKEYEPKGCTYTTSHKQSR